MIRRPPRSTRTDTLFPYTTLFRSRRRALGGFLPERRSHHVGLTLPGDDAYALPKKGSGTQEVATTMAFVRLLKDLLRAKDFGHRIVPIIPDEARTFGMDAYLDRKSTRLNSSH